MGQFNEKTVDKKSVEVRMVLGDREACDGQLFLCQDERLSDLLNDNREFLPFQTNEGAFRVVGKSAIASIEQRDTKIGGASQLEGGGHMSVDVARQILAVPKLYDRALVHNHASGITNLLEASPIDLAYIREAVEIATEVLLGELRMDALN